MSTVAPDTRLASRRAIEALRSGVPSRDAVAALGSGQTEVEDRFVALLSGISQGGTGRRPQGSGLLLGGGFGTGKSHVLEHLTTVALDAGFATSKVVISKETPLYDPVKVFRAAVDAAVSPGVAGAALREAATGLDVETPAYAELMRWAASPGSGLSERFAATLTLFRRAQSGDGEYADTIVRFWSGDPLPVPELRRRLREAGEGRPVLSAVSARELAVQRFRFAARLFGTAGYAGWVILFDEVELIGRYSLLQRGRSYAELGRWLGDPGDHDAPLVTVAAMTDDFEAAVLSTKNDRQQVPAKLRAKETPEADELAGMAEAGMRAIERDMVLLTRPDRAELDRAYRKVKGLHAEAFGWHPPDVPGLEQLGATRMRQYIRAWINEWDLVRLDPDFTPRTESVEIRSDYREDLELEGQVERGERAWE